MTLTPLEALFATAFLSLVVGMAVYLLTRSSFVSCRSCKERHKLVDDRLEKGERKFSRMENQIAALVIWNPDIPKDTKAELVGPGEVER